LQICAFDFSPWQIDLLFGCDGLEHAEGGVVASVLLDLPMRMARDPALARAYRFLALAFAVPPPEPSVPHQNDF